MLDLVNADPPVPASDEPVPPVEILEAFDFDFVELPLEDYKVIFKIRCKVL